MWVNDILVSKVWPINLINFIDFKNVKKSLNSLVCNVYLDKKVDKMYTALVSYKN